MNIIDTKEYSKIYKNKPVKVDEDNFKSYCRIIAILEDYRYENIIDSYKANDIRTPFKKHYIHIYAASLDKFKNTNEYKRLITHSLFDVKQNNNEIELSIQIFNEREK